jgi:hypothetical protein
MAFAVDWPPGGAQAFRLATLSHHLKRNRKGAKNAKVREEAEPGSDHSTRPPWRSFAFFAPLRFRFLSCFIGQQGTRPVAAGAGLFDDDTKHQGEPADAEETSAPA